MKKLFALAACLLLTSCSWKFGHNEKGYVIQKTHTPAYTTTAVHMMYTGNTYIPMVYTVHHKESWSLSLRDELDGNYEYYTVYLKDPEAWEAIEIGDYFEWSSEECFDCEPTTTSKGQTNTAAYSSLEGAY